jgi:hypothetical protein
MCIGNGQVCACVCMYVCVCVSDGVRVFSCCNLDDERWRLDFSHNLETGGKKLRRKMYQKKNKKLSNFFFDVCKNDFPRFINLCCFTFLDEKLFAPLPRTKYYRMPIRGPPDRWPNAHRWLPRPRSSAKHSPCALCIYHACMRLFSCKNNSPIEHTARTKRQRLWSVEFPPNGPTISQSPSSQGYSTYRSRVLTTWSSFTELVLFNIYIYMIVYLAGDDFNIH